jgi:hypothetical protein
MGARLGTGASAAGLAEKPDLSVSAKPAAGFPDFDSIRAAILAAPLIPAGFPLDVLHDAGVRQQLRTTPHLQSFLDAMRLEALRAQKTPLETLSYSLFRLFEMTGDRDAYQRVYFDRRRRLAGLVLAAVIDDTDDYLTSLYDLIWEICNEYTWALPAHLPVGMNLVIANPVPPEQVVDLFAAETAHMLAEIVSLLGDRLPDWLHYRVRTEVVERVFQPAFHGLHRFWWETASMNWASVCGGCAGMAALILVDDRERLAIMIDRVVRTMECFLDGFGSDGGCPEGISYWVYGFGYFTYFAEMLSAFTAGQIDLLQSQRVRQIAAFPETLSLGGGRYVNFSDAPEKVVIHPGLGSRLMARLSLSIPDLTRPLFHADPCFRWGHITRDLIWTEANALEKSVAEGSFHLDDLAWVIDRRIWDGNTIAFAAKGGHNGEPHNHNDLGHFILHVAGESLLTDLGAGIYTRQYFAEQRYDFLHTGSQGHSVPVINGRPQREGSNHLAVPLHFERRSDGVAFRLDLTRAYDDPTLESFVRSFDWSVDPLHHAAVLRLNDTFRFGTSNGRIVEHFISVVQPTISENTVKWQGRHGAVTMPFDPSIFNAEINVLHTQTHNAEPIVVYSLQMRVRKSERTQTLELSFELSL